MTLLRALMVIVIACFGALNAHAQTAGAPERVEIGLSTEVIYINSDFSGQELTIFGAADNIDPLVQRQGRYDVFLVLEGPRTDAIVRRKGRVFGIWMNVEDYLLATIPQSYLVASTRQPRDISDAETLNRLGLVAADLRMSARNAPVGIDPAFTDAVRAIKSRELLYANFPANVQFVSQSLFRARLELPANVPLGNHRVRAYLFKNGALAAQTQAPLRIQKAGIEIAIFNLAHEQSLLYGFLSVLLALLVGWLGRVLFRKD